jgi:hypothetical protein
MNEKIIRCRSIMADYFFFIDCDETNPVWEKVTVLHTTGDSQQNPQCKFEIGLSQ